MYEELLEAIMSLFETDSINETEEIEIDGNILTLSVDKKEGENKMTITVEYKEDEFKKYINSLDEDIFIEACEKFKDWSGQELTNDVDQNLFRSVVKRVIEERIAKLQRFM